MITVCPNCGSLNRIVDEKLNENPSCGKCKSDVFTGKPIEMTGEQLLRTIEKTDQTLVVDFWAPWCGPCKSFAPTFSQAAAQLEPNAKLIKINTEVEQQIAGKFGIRSIPTLAIFKNGKEVTRQAGAMDLNGFVNWVKSSN